MPLPPTLKLGAKGSEKSYIPMEIHRHSKYLCLNGKPMYLMRDPDGHTWMMQSYTDFVNKDLK